MNTHTPPGWRFPRLIEVAAAEKGAVKIGPFGSALKKHEYADAGIRVLGIDDVHPNRLTSGKCKYIPLTKYRELEQYTVKPGDVLVTNMGTVGRTCVVPHDLEPAIISSHLIKVSLDENQVVPTYLAWALNASSSVIAQITAESRGAIMAGFNSGLLKNLRIPLPPLSEQRRIADILDRAEAVRSKRHVAAAKLDTLAESIFVDMFDDQKRGSQPDPRVPIGDVLTFVTSGSRGWARYYASAGSRFVRSLDVRYNYVSNESAVFVTPPDNAEARRTCVEEGDVLLTITGSRIGRVAPVPADLAGAYISQHVAILRPASERILPRFLSQFLGMRTLGQRQIARAQYGQTKPGLNLTQIRALEIPLPPLARQREFENVLSAVSVLQSSQQEYLRVEGALQASLQDRAFRGAL